MPAHLDVDLARRLARTGPEWRPARGDWFLVDKPELVGTPFLLSDMVVEHLAGRHGPVLRFNGTTEWALDSVEKHETIWLPREDQLLDALAENLVSLRRGHGEWVVTLELGLNQRTVARRVRIDALGWALLTVRAFPRAPLDV
jgi:hypothetical protein